MKFKVIRAHTGDRDYSIGDDREASLSDVQHLIPKTLAPIEEKKSEAPPINKMEAAPMNKSTKARNGANETNQTIPQGTNK